MGYWPYFWEIVRKKAQLISPILLAVGEEAVLRRAEARVVEHGHEGRQLEAHALLLLLQVACRGRWRGAAAGRAGRATGAPAQGPGGGERARRGH